MNNATFAYFARKCFGNDSDPVKFMEELYQCLENNEDSNSDTVRSCIKQLKNQINSGSCIVTSNIPLNEKLRKQHASNIPTDTVCISFGNKGQLIIKFKKANIQYRNQLRDYGDGYGKVELFYVLNNRRANKTQDNKLKEIVDSDLSSDVKIASAIQKAVDCLISCS